MVRVVGMADVRLIWKSELSQMYPKLAAVAGKLLSLHATACSVERMWISVRWVLRDNRLSMVGKTVQNLVFVSAARRLRESLAADEPSDGDLLLADLVAEEEAQAIRTAAAVAAVAAAQGANT